VHLSVTALGVWNDPRVSGIPVSRRIDSLLHRRPDLSTFLVHLTAAEPTAEENLLSILSARTITARNPYGLLRDLATDTRVENPALYQSQLVVCLTETPLEHVWMMCENIADRGHPLASYGLAFSKPWARAVGANPVWYIDVLRTGHRGADWLTRSLFHIAKQTVRDGGQRYADPFNLTDRASPTMSGLPLEQSPIAEIAPFLETMGPVGAPGQTKRREFWWEREWRYRGDLGFQWSDVVAVFVPEDRHSEVRLKLEQLQPQDNPPAILDPTWGLERMIAALANVPPEYAGPLPWY
jgi:hypothetical protein